MNARMAPAYWFVLLMGGCVGTVGGEAAPASGEGSVPEEPRIKPFIVNGSKTSGFTAVGLVTFRTAGGGNYCTATLISRKTVLTAAHCIPRKQFVGTFVAGNRSYPVISARPHEAWADKVFPNVNDIGLVYLARPAAINPNAYGARPLVGTRIAMVGFGDTYEHDPGRPIKRVATNLVGNVERLMFNTKHPPNAGSQWGGICHGDSGGPTFGPKGSLIGVHSYWVWGPKGPGADACRSGRAQFARVEAFLPWIRKHLDRPTGKGTAGGSAAGTRSGGGRARSCRGGYRVVGACGGVEMFCDPARGYTCQRCAFGTKNCNRSQLCETQGSCSSGQGQSTGSGQAVQRGGPDADNDGVPDSRDRCSATDYFLSLHRAKSFHVTGEWAGCASGQYRDNDDWDRDGVPNGNDACPRTPLGRAVDSAGCQAGAGGSGFKWPDVGTGYAWPDTSPGFQWPDISPGFQWPDTGAGFQWPDISPGFQWPDI